MFCISLAQRYIPPAEGVVQDVFDLFFDDKGPRFMTRADFNKLPEDEKEELTREIMDVHDRAFDVFKKISSNLLLIFRYSTPVKEVGSIPETRYSYHRIFSDTVF